MERWEEERQYFDISFSHPCIQHTHNRSWIWCGVMVGCEKRILEYRLDFGVDSKLKSRLDSKLESKLDFSLDSKLNFRLDSKLESWLDFRLDSRLNRQTNRLKNIATQRTTALNKKKKIVKIENCGNYLHVSKNRFSVTTTNIINILYPPSTSTQFESSP